MSTGIVGWVLVGLSVLVLGAGVGLFVFKAVSAERRRRMRARRRRYEDLVGELVFRGESAARSFRGRADDPLFREVVLEYLRFIQGREREVLLDAVRRMGLVDRYVADLREGDVDRRVAAAEALGEIADPQTLPALVLALSDEVPEVRVQAAAALAAIGDPRAVRSLLAAMDREDEWNAQRFADALLAFGGSAIDDLTRYVLGTGRYRPLVARTLGLIGDLAAEPALLQALDSADRELRLRATAALGRAGSPGAVPYLVDLLADPEWEVRAQAASALGRTRDPAGLPALKRALADRAWWVRHNAAHALSQIPGGIAVLRSALDHPDPYARDAAAAVLLATDAARDAVYDLEVGDPLARARAEALIAALLKLGKEEYFRTLGVPDDTLAALRRRAHAF